MADVVITLKIMPESPDVDLEPIKQNAQKMIMEFGGQEDMKISEEPVAFGLKAVNMIFVMDEDIGSTEELEKQIAEIQDVSSVDITDVRRAIG